MEVTEEKDAAWAEAKKLLEKKEKTLGYEQNNALEHLRKFCKLSEKKAEEFMEELGKIGKLRERHKISIVNMMPKDMDELRVLFANEIIALSEDEKKGILSIVKKFA